MDQDELGMQVGLGPGHTVLDGDPAPPSQKGAEPPIFGPHICRGQMAGWIKTPLGREVGLSPSNIVLDGDPAPLPKKGAPICDPYLLWPNGWMDQDATWYGVRPQTRRHCVRWGPSSPPQKGAESPIFSPCLLWPDGWMDQDAIWHGGRSRPTTHCARWGPSSPPPKGDGAP